jgi:hypothetical protein
MRGRMSGMPDATKRRKWKTFAIGLSIRLVGVALIWLGDGHNSLFRKSFGRNRRRAYSLWNWCPQIFTSV